MVRNPRIWPDLAQKSGIWPNLARSGPKVGKSGQIWTPKVGKSGQKSGNRPKVGKSAKIREIGQKSGNLAKILGFRVFSLNTFPQIPQNTKKVARIVEKWPEKSPETQEKWPETLENTKFWP